MLKDTLYAQGLSHEIGGRKMGVIEGGEGFNGIFAAFFSFCIDGLGVFFCSISFSSKGKGRFSSVCASIFMRCIFRRSFLPNTAPENRGTSAGKGILMAEKTSVSSNQ